MLPERIREQAIQIKPSLISIGKGDRDWVQSLEDELTGDIFAE